MIKMKDVVVVCFEGQDVRELVYNFRLERYKEVWRTIKIDGEKTNYSVSNHGKIRNNKKKTIMDFSNSQRYAQITIKGHKYGVHRLVARYFIKIPKRYLDEGLTEKDLVPNHIDGIKLHNAAFNLEWVTQKENMDHAFNTGLCQGIFGEKSHLSKISKETAIDICELIMEKYTNKEILEMLGKREGEEITLKTIQHIRSGETWKSVVYKYNFPKLGEAKPFSISDETVIAICKELELNAKRKTEDKLSDTSIGKKIGVKRESVRDIRNRKRRKDISKNFKF